MKRHKKLVVSLIIIIAIPIIYYTYCYIFLNVFYHTYRDDYSFTINSVVNNDSLINHTNYKKYIWKRTLIEPIHGQWINKTSLYFYNDSLLFVSVTPGYIAENELTFPLLYPLGLEKDGEPFNTLYKVRNDSLFNFSTDRYFSRIELKNNKILIKNAFL